MNEEKNIQNEATDTKKCKKISNKMKVLVGLCIVFIIAVLAIIITYVAVGLSKPTGKEVGAIQKVEDMVKSDTQKLVELGNWVRFAEERDMYVDFGFNSLTKEFYYCEDSEPYRGYDVYEKYKFVSSNKIKVYNDDDNQKQYFKVISVDENTLVIEIEGKKETFTNEVTEYDTTKCFDYVDCKECKEFRNEPDKFTQVRKAGSDTVTLAESGEKTKVTDYKLAQNAKIYDMYVSESYDDNDEIIHKCDIKEVKIEDINKLIDVVYPSGLVWLNDTGEIEKFVIFRVKEDYKVPEM